MPREVDGHVCYVWVQGGGEGQGDETTMRRGRKAWEPEELAALEQVMDRFPPGKFSWKKRHEEFGAC
jgi:hypothetical protein